MKYPKSRKSRGGDIGSLEQRKAYYDNRPKCIHCKYENIDADKDRYKLGLPLAFKNKWKLLEHYNHTHPKLFTDVANLFSADEVVKCPICNMTLGQIGHKHLANHFITKEQFKEKFPEASMRPDNMKVVWSNRCSKVNITKAMRKKVSKSLSEGYASGKYDELKKQISITKKERFASGEIVTWNKGLTKNDHPSLMSTSDKFRKIWAKRRIEGGSKIRGYFNSDKNKKEIPYRSSYELRAFQLLEEDKGIEKYDYESLRIRYRDKNNKLRSYYPDIVTNTKRIIEVKSDWVFKKQSGDDDLFRKLRAAERWATKNNYTFEVWTERELGIR